MLGDSDAYGSSKRGSWTHAVHGDRQGTERGENIFSEKDTNSVSIERAKFTVSLITLFRAAYSHPAAQTLWSTMQESTSSSQKMGPRRNFSNAHVQARARPALPVTPILHDSALRWRQFRAV